MKKLCDILCHFIIIIFVLKADELKWRLFTALDNFNIYGEPKEPTPAPKLVSKPVEDESFIEDYRQNDESISEMHLLLKSKSILDYNKGTRLSEMFYDKDRIENHMSIKSASTVLSYEYIHVPIDYCMVCTRENYLEKPEINDFITNLERDGIETVATSGIV